MMHHAYYVEGPLSLFEAYKELMKPFWAQRFERFGIEDVRELIEQAQLKNVGRATFLIATASLPTEAQQALLKLFEEPQPGTAFILLVPYGTIIPTLRSRMLPYPTKVRHPMSDFGAKKFLKMSYKDRSAYITKLLKTDEVREPVRELLNSLEIELYKQLKKTLHHNKISRFNLDIRQGLEDIVRVRSYVSDRSPSFKMLLEHLAISLPTL